ncbi:hypothetical protein WMF18_25050 [Sorangium sp. So ce315]|uniref:hypothetical protein n=1 Tax=Sorangium sp. So ce315 TaxID=3133299 RepID=UPI003F5DF4E0
MGRLYGQALPWLPAVELRGEGIFIRFDGACHACLLALETSCQHFNLRLDRAMLIGTPEASNVGYFRDILAELT